MPTAPIALALATLAFAGQAPSDWDATRRTGQDLIRTGRTAEALVLFERALAQAPTFDGAIEAVANAHHLMATQRPAEVGADGRRAHLEAAAAQYRRLAERTVSPYRQLAVLKLVDVLGENGLNRPSEAVRFARLQVEGDPAAEAGHAQLARLLTAAGRRPEATAVLLAARSRVRGEPPTLLATAMVAHLADTPDVGRADLAALLDFAEPIIDRAVRLAPGHRPHVLTKVAALRIRAERLETGAASRRALLAEADRLFDATSPSRRERPVATDAAFAPLDGAADRGSGAAAQPVDPPGAPAGFGAAMQEAAALGARGEFAKAAAIYERFVRSHPAFPQAHYLRLSALVSAGQHQMLDAGLKAARRAVPATAEARHLSGVYLLGIVTGAKNLRADDARLLIAEANGVLDEALKLRPRHPESLTYKALVLQQQARVEPDPAAAARLRAEAERFKSEAAAARKTP